jgi:tol-pal system protein YbgF
MILGPSTSVLAQQQAAGAQSTAALAKRVEQLEEQLVDMRVVIGTLESLSRSGGGAAGPASGGMSGNEAARLQGMETQIRALTAQVEQLSRQIQSGSGRGGYEPAGAVRGMGGTAGAPQSASLPAAGSNYGGQGYGARTAGLEDAGSQDFGGFGSTTVTTDTGSEDPIGGLLSQGDSQIGFGTQMAATAPVGGGDPKQLYETAYGYLLQQDYGAAEAAFNDFLKSHPNDQLAGNAQYWLGETYFVRAQYKAAAAAFLKGYESYRQSPKAPDSLLKLAMSLDRLGQREAACSSFSELNAQFPNAPQHVRERAAAERKRVGC